MLYLIYLTFLFSIRNFNFAKKNFFLIFLYFHSGLSQSYFSIEKHRIVIVSSSYTIRYLQSCSGLYLKVNFKLKMKSTFHNYIYFRDSASRVFHLIQNNAYTLRQLPNRNKNYQFTHKCHSIQQQQKTGDNFFLCLWIIAWYDIYIYMIWYIRNWSVPEFINDIAYLRYLLYQTETMPQFSSH